MKRQIKRILSLFIIFSIFFNTIINITVAANTNDPESEKLIIKIGYEGGPYEVYKRYSRAELRPLSSELVPYTHVKGSGDIMYNVARGPNIRTLLSYAGVLDNAIKRFVFVTPDRYIVNNQNFTRDYILNTQRYHYPGFIDYGISRESLPYATSSSSGSRGTSVKLAIESLDAPINYNQNSNSEDIKKRLEDAMKGIGLGTSKGFRLMIGAAEFPNTLDEKTAMFSAQNVTEIDLVLLGAPAVETTITDITKGPISGGGTTDRYDDEQGLQEGDEITLENKAVTIGGEDGETKYDASTYMMNEAFNNSYGKENIPSPQITDYNKEYLEDLGNGKFRVLKAGKIEDFGIKTAIGTSEGIDVFTRGRVDNKEGGTSTVLSFNSTDGTKKQIVTHDFSNLFQGKPSEPEPSEPPEQPEEPTNPPPEQPENPSKEPEKPEQPGNSEKPPKEPGKPKQPGNSENPPKEPGKPKQPGNSENPPKEPGKPEQPGNSGKPPKEPGKPEQPGNPDKPSKPQKKPKVPEPNLNQDNIDKPKAPFNNVENNKNENNNGNKNDDKNSKGNNDKDTIEKNRQYENDGKDDKENNGNSRTYLSLNSGNRNLNLTNDDLNNHNKNNTNKNLKNKDSSKNDNKNKSTEKSEIANNQKSEELLKDEGNFTANNMENKVKAVDSQVYEIDKDAVQLGEIELDNPLQPWSILIGVASFLFGVIYAKWRFMRSL